MVETWVECCAADLGTIGVEMLEEVDIQGDVEAIWSRGPTLTKADENVLPSPYSLSPIPAKCHDNS